VPSATVQAQHAASALKLGLLIEQLPALRETQLDLDPLNRLQSWVGDVVGDLQLSWRRSETQPGIVLVKVPVRMLALHTLMSLTGHDFLFHCCSSSRPWNTVQGD